jgi:SAM-dependent methyltransferase
LEDESPQDDPRRDWDWDDAYVGDGSETTPLDEQLLADVLGLVPGRALDLGCGAGGNAIGLAQRGWQVTGIDISTKAIASARQSADSAGFDIFFEVTDVTTWEPHDDYELVLSSYALPPQGSQRVAALAVARNALAPGGILVVGEFDATAMSWGKRSDFVTVEEMIKAVEGLEAIRIESVATKPHDHGDHGSKSNQSELRAVIAVARRPVA